MDEEKPSQPAQEPAAAEAAGPESYLPRERYQETFDFAPDAQLLTDSSGIILEANNSAASLLRCPKEFLIGKPLALFSVNGHRRRFYESLWKLRQESASDAFESLVARRPDDLREVAVEVRASREKGLEGRKFHWFMRDVTDRNRAEVSRTDLVRRLTSAQEDERRRISRDLHDTLGQTLTALSLGLRTLKNAIELPADSREYLANIERLADALGRQLHEVATRLRPASLDDLGLEAALRHLIRDWSAQTNLVVEFHSTLAGSQRFPPELETTLYRVVQESLTNVARHAGPCHVSVVIERSAEDAVVVVEDNGIGFNLEESPRVAPGGTKHRLGIVGMRERVSVLGGTMLVESEPGLGTTVIARIPLPHHS